MPSKRAPDLYALVADIGGTNTRVALAEGTSLLPDTVRRYRNADHARLEDVLHRFLDDEGGVACKGACIAVAGPVRDGVGALTNLDWRMDRTTLANATGAKNVAILNDLQAQGHGLGKIDAKNLREVFAGAPAGPNAAQLVVGVGTGFNIAAVYDTANGRLVTPSEAGHSTMPVRTEDDLRLSQFVESFHGAPGVEDVLSGRGLERIYNWLSQEAGTEKSQAAADIMAACADNTDPMAQQAVQVFVRLLGGVVGNLALTHLPFGGIYLAGGVARAFVPYLEAFEFQRWFCDKGRFAEFMQNFSVSVIEDDYAALIGCANHLEALG